MEYRIGCKRCGSPIVQMFERVAEGQVLVITECMHRDCKFKTGIVVPLPEILISSPSVAWKLYNYGIVCKP